MGESIYQRLWTWLYKQSNKSITTCMEPFTISTYEPHECINMDLVGPLPEDKMHSCHHRYFQSMGRTLSDAWPNSSNSSALPTTTICHITTLAYSIRKCNCRTCKCWSHKSVREFVFEQNELTSWLLFFLSLIEPSMQRITLLLEWHQLLWC